jgi:hypothetical protein
MAQERKLGVCVNCQEFKPIYRFGMCGMCAMREYRKERNLGDPAWARDTAMQYRQSRKRQHKDRKKIGTIVEMLDDIFALTPEDKETILRTLRPYLVALDESLIPTQGDSPIVNVDSENPLPLTDGALVELTRAPDDPVNTVNQTTPMMLTVDELDSLEQERVAEDTEVTEPEPATSTPSMAVNVDRPKREIILPGEEYKMENRQVRAGRIARRRVRSKKRRTSKKRK